MSLDNRNSITFAMMALNPDLDIFISAFNETTQFYPQCIFTINSRNIFIFDF